MLHKLCILPSLSRSRVCSFRLGDKPVAVRRPYRRLEVTDLNVQERTKYLFWEIGQANGMISALQHTNAIVFSPCRAWVFQVNTFEHRSCE